MAFLIVSAPPSPTLFTHAIIRCPTNADRAEAGWSIRWAMGGGVCAAVDIYGGDSAGWNGTVLLRAYGVPGRYSRDTAVANPGDDALQRGNVQVGCASG